MMPSQKCLAKRNAKNNYNESWHPQQSTLILIIVIIPSDISTTPQVHLTYMISTIILLGKGIHA